MTRRAVVVGGGIGGLAAAIGLRGTGWDVTVYEQADGLTEVGAGIALWQNGLRALDDLGVGDAVRAVAGPGFGGAIRDVTGRVIANVDPPRVVERYGGLGVVLHRADLIDLLAKSYGDVSVGSRVTSVLPGDRRATVVSPGDPVVADLVVGADGLNSVVRAVLHGSTPPRYTGVTAWRALVDFPADQLLPGETWGDGETFGRVAVARDRAYVFGAARAPQGARAPDEKAEMLRRFGSWHVPLPDIVASIESDAILRNDIFDRPVLRQWSRGCVTLLGDSAHPMAPALGQGACQALEDAAALARIVTPDRDVVDALSEYEAARSRRANRFVRQSRLLTDVMFRSRTLRDFGARRVLPLVQPRAFAQMLG